MNTGTPAFHRTDFPEGFLFGVASSAYQIEGHGLGGAGSTHWDSFSATPGNVCNRDDGAIACDHYHLYDEDLALAAGIGFDAWRFSTSWARILPHGTGSPNSAGLAFYDRLVDAMLEHGLKPCLTLYHWELPSALADLGGWTNPDITGWFGDFAALVGRRLGDRLHSVAPINEPWCVAWLGHLTGDHAPGLRDIRAAARSMHHVPLAHDRAVAALRSEGVDNIGMVVNFEYVQPADTSANSMTASAVYDAVYNHWFLGAVRNGHYPQMVVEHIGQHLPRGWEGELAAMRSDIDWVGINYYTRKIIAHDGTDGFPFWRELPGLLPTTGMGWEIYPEGLGHFIRVVHDEYANGRPIMVTENGMADPLDQSDPLHDRLRWDYVQGHLAEIRKCIDRGIDIRGYFIWSLLDNFEWSLGYGQRFGIVHVDRPSLARRPKWSCSMLRQSLKG